MNKLLINLLILTAFIFSNELVGQQMNIVLQAEGTVDSISLKWMPYSSSDYFDEMFYGGYMIDRKDVQLSVLDSTLRDDGEYTYILDTVILDNTLVTLHDENSPIMMQDSLWWTKNSNAYGGIADLIGKVLYDPLVDVSTEDLNPQVASYEYVKYTYMNVPQLIPSLGLGMIDRTVKSAVAYQYTLRSKLIPGASVSVIVASVDGNYATSDEEFFLENPKVDIPSRTDRLASIEEPQTIYLQSKPLGDSIILKWLPNDANLFKAGLDMGYRVMRKSLGDWEQIDEVKPWTKAEYDKRKNVRDSAFIASSMVVYGDFGGDDNPMAKSNANQDRYAFGAYTFELSQLAAQAMGLRYVDNDVQQGESYEYRVEFLNINYEGITGGRNVLNEKIVLKAPIDLQAESREYAIALSIDAPENNRMFTYYFIDRSEDGNNWTQVHDRPILFAETDDNYTRRYEYVDSVAVLYKAYQYRIRGMDSFGELSPETTITAEAIDLTPPTAVIIDTVYYEDNIGAQIKWIPDDSEPDFAGYKVQIGRNIIGEFTDVSPLLPKGTASFTYVTPIDTELPYFFRVASIDENKNESTSVALTLPVIDSIPPSPPTGLAGFIDDDGIAYLSWEHSPERDLTGYRVYFANDPEAEFSQLTQDIIDVNLYTDTVALNILDENIYYKVDAQDNQFNRSEFSEIIKLERPDIIPPVTPAMLPPVSVVDGIDLNWNLSNSDDVVMQLLYRRLEDAENWELISELEPSVASYLDSLVEYETVYEYAIQAKDDAELLSELSLPLQGRRYFEKELGSVENLLAEEVDKKIRLSWSYLNQEDDHLKDEDYRFQVYRSVDGQPIKRYLQLVSKDTTFEDDEVETGIEYVYAIQVIFESGKSSDLSEAVLIEKQ